MSCVLCFGTQLPQVMTKSDCKQIEAFGLSPLLYDSSVTDGKANFNSIVQYCGNFVEFEVESLRKMKVVLKVIHVSNR